MTTRDEKLSKWPAVYVNSINLITTYILTENLDRTKSELNRFVLLINFAFW